MEKKVDLLVGLTRQQGKVMQAIHNYIKAVDDRGKVVAKGLAQSLEKMEGLDERMKAIYSAMEAIGKGRISNCVYSRDGFCVNITNAVSDPSKEKRNTVKIKDIYYPRVEWLDCYLCSNFEVPPEKIPD